MPQKNPHATYTNNFVRPTGTPQSRAVSSLDPTAKMWRPSRVYRSRNADAATPSSSIQIPSGKIRQLCVGLESVGSMIELIQLGSGG
jgi:hypothetical protein